MNIPAMAVPPTRRLAHQVKMNDVTRLGDLRVALAALAVI